MTEVPPVPQAGLRGEALRAGISSTVFVLGAYRTPLSGGEKWGGLVPYALGPS
jgi:hypothetical protein